MIVGSLSLLEEVLAQRLADVQPWIDQSLALGKGKAIVGDVALPTYGVAVAQGAIDSVDERVERQVEKDVAHAVVGQFKGYWATERMMGETGQGLVFVGPTHAIGKRLGRVRGTEHIDLVGRHDANRLIKQIVDPLL